MPCRANTGDEYNPEKPSYAKILENPVVMHNLKTILGSEESLKSVSRVTRGIRLSSLLYGLPVWVNKVRAYNLKQCYGQLNVAYFIHQAAHGSAGAVLLSRPFTSECSSVLSDSCEILKSHHNLKPISIMFTAENTQSSNSFLEHLPQKCPLKLEINCNHKSSDMDEGYLAGEHLMQQFSRLIGLSIQSCSLNKQYIALIAGALQQDDSKLQTLNLRDNGIDITSATLLSKAIQKNTAFQSLTLTQNEIMDEGP